MNTPIKVRELTRYRSCWMGFAIVWLVFYHGQPTLHIRGLTVFQNVGYGGVDIFLFASGLGCYCSLNRDHDPIHFLRKRFLNLMPVYWCFILVWIIFRKLTTGISFFSAVGNFLGIEMFASTEESFNWYISGIWVLYLLAPYLKRMTDHCRTVFSQLQILVLLFAVSLPFWQTSILLIFVSRIPVFYLGMIIGKLAEKDCELKEKHIVLILSGTAAGIFLLIYGFRCHPSMLVNCGIMWYPFFLIAPGICFAISWLLMKTENTAPGAMVKKILQMIGGSTFEIYLVHLLLFEGIYRYFIAAQINISDSLLKLICFVVIVPGTLLLKKCGHMTKTAIETGMKKYENRQWER